MPNGNPNKPTRSRARISKDKNGNENKNDDGQDSGDKSPNKNQDNQEQQEKRRIRTTAEKKTIKGTATKIKANSKGATNPARQSPTKPATKSPITNKGARANRVKAIKARTTKTTPAMMPRRHQVPIARKTATTNPVAIKRPVPPMRATIKRPARILRPTRTATINNPPPAAKLVVRKKEFHAVTLKTPAARKKARRTTATFAAKLRTMAKSSKSC